MEKLTELELVPLCISFGWQAKDVAKMAERLSANLRLLGGLTPEKLVAARRLAVRTGGDLGALLVAIDGLMVIRREE